MGASSAVGNVSVSEANRGPRSWRLTSRLRPSFSLRILFGLWAFRGGLWCPNKTGTAVSDPLRARKHLHSDRKLLCRRRSWRRMCPAIVDSWPNYIADFILVHSYRSLTVRIPLSLLGQTPGWEASIRLFFYPTSHTYDFGRERSGAFIGVKAPGASVLCREVRRLGQPCGGWPVPRLSAKPSPTHLVNLRFEGRRRRRGPELYPPRRRPKTNRTGGSGSPRS